MKNYRKYSVVQSTSTHLTVTPNLEGNKGQKAQPSNIKTEFLFSHSRPDSLLPSLYNTKPMQSVPGVIILKLQQLTRLTLQQCEVLSN